MKIYLTIILILFANMTNAQSMYDTGMMSAYLNAYGQMTQRAIQISHAVQPYREQQYQLYQQGRYQESINVCQEVMNKYVYYVFDNRGIRDMEVLAGDAAARISNYGHAIYWYKTAIEAKDQDAPYRLSILFNDLVHKAEISYYNGEISKVKDFLSYAAQTGHENGDYYYYWGVYYENIGRYDLAKSYMKKAKRFKHPDSADAIKRIKEKQKAQK